MIKQGDRAQKNYRRSEMLPFVSIDLDNEVRENYYAE